jgi:hypothetical protein
MDEIEKEVQEKVQKEVSKYKIEKLDSLRLYVIEKINNSDIGEPAKLALTVRMLELDYNGLLEFSRAYGKKDW